MMIMGDDLDDDENDDSNDNGSNDDDDDASVDSDVVDDSGIGETKFSDYSYSIDGGDYSYYHTSTNDNYARENHKNFGVIEV